jgi:hypothetical protein
LRQGRRQARGAAAAWSRLWARLFAPVDNASLVFFRIAFGLLAGWEMWLYLIRDIARVRLVEPAFVIGWPGFEWLPRWPEPWLYVHIYALVGLSLLVAAGALYRVTSVLFCLGYVYVFLLSQSNFQNHTYLICLVCLLLAGMPAHRSLSVDAWLRPGLRRDTAPAWCVWILRAQLAIVYFYGGVAKLNADWLQGYPMRLWMPRTATLPVLGAVFEQAWVAVAMSWAGIAIDLGAAFALLHRRTRIPAFAVLVAFHLWNSRLFHIGVFPWLAIASTTIFLDPSWPRRIFRWPRAAAEPPPEPFRWTPAHRAAAGLLCAYLAVQLLVPLRQFLYPGDASWTGEGHTFAWRMMLRDRDGHVRFSLTDPDTGESWLVDPTDDLGGRVPYRKLATTPPLIHLYARHLAEVATGPGKPRVQVRAIALASLNQREPEPLIDPSVDLGAQPVRWFGHAPWIPPYTKPLGRDWMRKYVDVPPEGEGAEFD